MRNNLDTVALVGILFLVTGCVCFVFPSISQILQNGWRIGRIRYATERSGHNCGWDWHINPPLPIPAWANGTADTLEAAKAAFSAACARFHETLTSDDIGHWHGIVAAAIARAEL